MRDCQVKGSERPCPAIQHESVERDNPRPAAFALGQLEVQRRTLPRALRNLSSSGARSHLARASGHLLGTHLHPLARVLVIVATSRTGLPSAGGRPPSGFAFGREQTRPARERMLVFGLGPGQGAVALALERRPVPVEVLRAARMWVQLDDLSDRVCKQLAIVGDEDDRASMGMKQRSQSPQPIVIEVIGRLVQQHDVEPRDRQRREPRPRSLASGQAPQRTVEEFLIEPELKECSRHPRIDIAAAKGQPPLECGGMSLDHIQFARHQRPRPVLQLPARSGDADTFEDHAPHCRLRAARAADLREVSHGPEATDGATVGSFETSQDAEQRRLASAVLADQPDPSSSVDAQTDSIEDRSGSVAPRDLLSGEQRGRHRDPFRETNGTGTFAMTRSRPVNQSWRMSANVTHNGPGRAAAHGTKCWGFPQAGFTSRRTR